MRTLIHDKRYRWNILGSLVALGIALLMALVLFLTQAEPERKPPPKLVPIVEVLPLERKDYTLWLRSQGTVSAWTQSTLVAEVSGRILAIAPVFRDGGFFEAGEQLIQLDDRDYRTALFIAEAEVARAELNLAQEQARAEQAREDWIQLGGTDNPATPLLLREPQLKEAATGLQAARARVQQAKWNLERTIIQAPYAGRVLEQTADIGQFVTSQIPLARIFSVDAGEIRLPLSLREVGFLNLPEQTNGRTQPESPSRVLLDARIGDQTVTWEGRLVRTEGALDPRTRQLFVVARVDDPYGRKKALPFPLKVGLFVEARIEGHTLNDVIVIPRKALREGREVLIVGEGDILERRQVEVLWGDTEDVVVQSGVDSGERLCLTPLPYAASGIRVQVSETPDASPAPPNDTV